MSRNKTSKILFTILLFSLSAIISSSYDNIYLNHNSSAYAQTPSTSTDRGTNPVPENDYTNIGNGPIPEDNSTDNIGNGPIPEDNSTSPDNSANPPGMPDFNNLTNSGFPADVTAIVNNATSPGTNQTTPPSVPEFGSLAGMIIAISIIGVVLLSRKLSYRAL